MFGNNTEQVNRIIKNTMAICTISSVVLLIVRWVDFIGFSNRVVITLCVASVLTLSPIILDLLDVNQEFLKNYMLIILAMIIGALGSDFSIGIYITYILAPIASGLYFDKKLTLRTCFISYICMAVALYFNSENKLELTVYGWT